MSVVPDDVHEEVKISEGKPNDETTTFYYRVDVLWWYLFHFYCASFHKLHFIDRNAELEHLFSIVRKNKIDTRSSLKFDGTNKPNLMFLFTSGSPRTQ